MQKEQEKEFLTDQINYGIVVAGENAEINKLKHLITQLDLVVRYQKKSISFLRIQEE